MKIGVDIRVLMDKQYSGISEYTAKLLSEILHQDQNNEYKLFYNSYQDLTERLSVWERGNAQVKGLHYPNKIFNYFLQKILGYPLIDQVLGGVDLFWSPHFNFTKLSGPESGLKKVITVHDLSFLRYPEFFSRRKNFWHQSLGVIKELQAAEAIVAVSENTKNDIIELAGVPADKISIIYSGNNVTKRDWQPDEVNACVEKFGLNNPYILYVGNIEPRKNISGLIKAFNEIKGLGEEAIQSGVVNNYENLELVLAGAPGWKNTRIYSDWQASPYRNSIKFIGYVSANEKEILYSRAAVFAYPSFYEGFGFPPLEAMAYGVPVVCSNVSSLPEIVAEAAVMINPNEPSEIAQALQLVLTDNRLREKLIAAGYARTRLFTWEKAAAEYLELFKKIA